MKPLQTNFSVLKLLCMYPSDVGTSVLVKLAYVSFTLLTLNILAITDIGSAVFFWKFVSIDLVQALYAFAQAVEVFNTLYTFVILFHKRNAFKAMLDKLPEIYNASKNQFK